MSRAGRTGTRYITPIDSNGVPQTEQGKGIYVLTAGATYHYLLGGDEAPFASVHLTTYQPSGLSIPVITSATIRDCNHRPDEVSDQDLTAGNWPPENPATAFVATEGSGWSAPSGVAASTGAAVGGALWHIAETGAFRTKLTVVMGGTGGAVRVSGHGKR